MLEKNLNIKIWVIPTILQTLIQGYFYKSKVVASELKNPLKVDGLEKKRKTQIFLKKIITIILSKFQLILSLVPILNMLSILIGEKYLNHLENLM